jgi:hypothetical protein
MSLQRSGKEQAVILVKALPQPSETYGETVCVAGLTRSGEWRRLYPVRFRQLQDKFKRWQWIEYECRSPKDDRRHESRNVDENSIEPLSILRPGERSTFLGPRTRQSTDEAASLRESLTIIRPTDTRFSWQPKSESEIASERLTFADAARQLSLLDMDKELRALDPCPYKFFFEYKSSDGKSHRNFCHDWETSAAFHNLSKMYGAAGALEHLDHEYNERYPKAGMAFALGTHSQRPEQWLLIGVLRLDNDRQSGFSF